MAGEQYKHIFLDNSGEAIGYTPRLTPGPESRIPERNRKGHAEKLRNQLNAAWSETAKYVAERTAVALPVKDGAYLEVIGSSGYDLATKSLEDRKSGIRLLNSRQVSSTDASELRETRATVYIPAGKEHMLLDKIKKYESEETSTGKPKNQKLINSIEDIRIAMLAAFWQDDYRLMPQDDPVWCEVWLRSATDQEDAAVNNFHGFAQQMQIEVQEGCLEFPERKVVMAKVNLEQLQELIESSPYIAELRRAKETARFFRELSNFNQMEWVDDLLSRLEVRDDTAIAITVLDTGANNGHPLLEPLLDDTDRHTVNPDWGTHDHDGHGTMMCGVAGYGNLIAALESKSGLAMPYCLESVKILPPHGKNDPKLYGYITIQGLSRAEIKQPDRCHIACMAVSSVDNRDRGRPSSWSAALDQLTSGYDDETKRLFIVAAGNVGEEEWSRYPDSNLTASIHDPGQSWNALTVGAYTAKVNIADPELKGHEPIAPSGGLSPFSSTSLSWETNKWPLKPDIVLEGGNVARAPNGEYVSTHDDLSILSAYHEPTVRHFDVFTATSAATAQAAWLAATIQANYPNAWPETIRGLLVHSAKWTDAMKNEFIDTGTKTEFSRLIRICGYGIPDLNRALHCYRNSLTLIAQEEIQPYDKKPPGKSGYCTKDMHIHELPWPKDILLGLGETPVNLRITLSYFIEPGPGEVGWKDRYRYASHAFRFDLNNVSEDRETFLKRLNVQSREEGEKTNSSSGSERWLIGSNGRDAGSVHSDIWEGTAAELATCNMVGIYPIIGWWRERYWLDRWNKKARYSLIVSINTPDTEVNIYTPVTNMIRQKISVSATNS